MNLLRTLKRFSGQPTSGRRSQRGRARLVVEVLESRVTPSVTLNNGHLVVTGAPNDQISILLNSFGGVLVNVNNSGARFSYLPGQVSSIEVDTASAGSASVLVDATPASVPLSISSFGTGKDSLGKVGDFVDLGVGNGTSFYSVDNILGPVSVNGNALTHGLFDEYSDPNTDPVTITSTSVSRAGFGGLTYSGLASLDFYEPDYTRPITFNVNSTMSGTVYNWDGQITDVGNTLVLSSDTFNLGTGNLGVLQGAIFTYDTIVTMVMDDHASPGAHGYTIDKSPAANGIYVSGNGFSVEIDGGFGAFGSLTIDGGIGNDAFNVMPFTQNLGALNGIALTFNGGTGSNTLTVNDQNNPSGENYLASSGGTGLVLVGNFSVRYRGIQSVTVNGSNDGSTFQVPSIAHGTAVTINAGEGVNNVLVGDSHGVGDIQGTLNVSGAAGGFTTVTLDDTANTTGRSFLVTSSQVLVGLGASHVYFSGIQSLVLDGGSGANSFVLLSTPVGLVTTINAGPHGDSILAGGNLLGNAGNFLGPLVINGQTDTNHPTLTVFDGSAPSPETYTLTVSSAGEEINRSGGLVAFCTKIKSLTVTGGNGGDDFVDLAIPTSLVTFNGGSGLNALSATEGVGHYTGWAITGPGSGRVGRQLTFTGMHDLVSISSFDDFQFFTGGSIAGSIAGGGRFGNILSYAHETGPVTVNVQTGAAPQINGGAAGGFSGIHNFQGSTSSANTLIGPNADTTWTISQANSGSWITGGREFAFGGFQNLVGGSGLDVFKFTAGGGLSGKLDGGGAPLHEGNWLDYSALTTAVRVNLQTGKASGVAGGVVNIQNVHGGNGGNTLTGDAQGNILIGGTGKNTILGGTGTSILIGDAGAGTVTGGSGSDILIGASTVFDPMTAANEAALMSILAEWQSSDSYATRFHDINTGTGAGLNGRAKLNFGTTVLADTKVDVLTAASSVHALDWFFQGPGDILHNVEAGEHINNS